MRRLGFAFHPSYLSHDTGPGHPEQPARLLAICDHLRTVGLWDRLIPLHPSAASLDLIELVHPRPYLRVIEEACRSGPTALDPDTIVSPGSWEAARHATGAVIQSIDRLASGTLDASFCAVRPPGHHASTTRAMGFCLFNHVAIGARYAQQRHHMDRVLIVDWDVHHGNGTQAIFEEDSSVFYFSTHQYPFYPGTGARHDTGRGAGMSMVLNVPLPAGSGDTELLQALREVLLPKALAFKPHLILISSGFDAHRDDPLASLTVTESGYAQATRVVRELADHCCRGRIVSVLEGGYHLLALGRSVEAHLRVLLE